MITIIKNNFPYSILLIGSYYVQGFGIPKKCDKIGLDSDRPYYGAQCGAATSTLTQNSSVRFGTETKNIEHHHVARRRQHWVEINSEEAF